MDKEQKSKIDITLERLYEIALEADRLECDKAAIDLYETIITHADAPLDAFINLAIVYNDVTEPIFIHSATRGITDEFMKTHRSRRHRVLKLAARRFGTTGEIALWWEHCRYFGKRINILDYLKAIGRLEESFSPDSPENQDRFDSERRRLLAECRENPCAKNRALLIESWDFAQDEALKDTGAAEESRPPKKNRLQESINHSIEHFLFEDPDRRRLLFDLHGVISEEEAGSLIDSRIIRKIRETWKKGDIDRIDEDWAMDLKLINDGHAARVENRREIGTQLEEMSVVSRIIRLFSLYLTGLLLGTDLDMMFGKCGLFEFETKDRFFEIMGDFQVDLASYCSHRIWRMQSAYLNDDELETEVAKAKKVCIDEWKRRYRNLFSTDCAE